MKNLIFTFLIILLCVVNSIAQITIQGSVTDSKTNEKLIGVSVLIKGSAKGVQTDYDGQFVLKTTNNLPLILVIKYLGFETREININDAKNKISIKLSKSEKALKEVSIRDSRITEKMKQNPEWVEKKNKISIERYHKKKLLMQNSF